MRKQRRLIISGIIVLALVGAISALSLQALAPDAEAGGTYTVNSTADPGAGTCGDGTCTLREAITAANMSDGNTIEFNLPGCPGTCTIALVTDLPTIMSNDTSIDGQSQPGWMDEPIVTIDGNDMAGSGILLEGSGPRIRGLSLMNFSNSAIGDNTDGGIDGALITNNTIRDYGQYGISLQAQNTTISDNVINGEGVATQEGIMLAGGGGADNVTVSGNTVSGNLEFGIGASGVDIRIMDNLVTGNGRHGISTAFGGGADGAIISGNTSNDNGEHGIRTSGDGTMIVGNTVSGNSQSGIDTGSGDGVVISGNTVTGNLGKTPFRANVGPGGFMFPAPGGIEAGDNATITGNTVTGNGGPGIVPGQGSIVGGLGEGDGNTIANNGEAGVNIPEEIGPSAAGEDAPITDVTISGNAIYSNDGLGIDIGLPGVTENDEGDNDTGTNRRQNFPLLTSAVAGSLAVTGALNSRPERTFRIEFFANDECDPSGNGEGQVYLGSHEVTTDTEGNAAFAVELDENVSLTTPITATATSLDTNDTSEFSPCVAVTGEPEPTPTPTTAPTATAGPTVTPTPTPVATDTPAPSETPEPEARQGDVDCDGDVDTVDALKVLRHVAALPVLQNEPCDDIGTGLARIGAEGDVTGVGDVDCDEDVDSVDALKILRQVASLPVTQTQPCQDIGT